MTKARDVERDAVGLYQTAGYEVYHPPKAKYRDQDVFGLFDLVAFGHGRLDLAQVKCNRARGIQDWFDEARVFEKHLEAVRIGFLVYHDAGAWQLARTDPDGYQWVYDGRETGPMDTRGLEVWLKG